MHAKGWSRKVSYSNLATVKYTFEKCQPGRCLIQLDFYSMKNQREPPIYNLFKDCGWEHITDFNFPILEKHILELNQSVMTLQGS